MQNFDHSTTLRCLKLLAGQTGMETFDSWRTLVFVWGFPMIFASTCFLLDNFQVAGIGCGDEEACWLAKGNAKIVFFLNSIACVLLYNVGVFSLTM